MMRKIVLPCLALLAFSIPPTRADAAFILASGQALIPGGPGHDDTRENRIYRIDTTTGIATPATPPIAPPVGDHAPAALAITSDGRLLGIDGGQLGQVSTTTGGFSPIGGPLGISPTGFDITDDGRGFAVSLTGSRQLYRINLSGGPAVPVGPAGAIGSAIDAAFGLASGTSQPFIIGLGSVGSTLYGVDLEAGRTNLIAIDAGTGSARVLGGPNAVGGAFGGRYSGFAAMTGVDEDGDGRFDALFGAVNFDGNARLGGVARFDLAAGTFSLVGTNPGLIFFGFGSAPAAVPEPASLALLGIGVLAPLVASRARSRACRPADQRPRAAASGGPGHAEGAR